MNISTTLLKWFALGALVVGFATLLGGWHLGRMPIVSAERAPRESQRNIATLFGMQTLAPGQTAQIAVVNPLEIIPCVRVRIAFDLYEADPANPIRLHFVRSVSREVELEPGEAVSVEYTAGGRGAFVSPASFAREINEVGDPHAPSRVENGPAEVVRTRTSGAISTLSINERGHVVFTAPGVRVGFDPQPDPPSPN
jgi:hypothetical protein